MNPLRKIADRLMNWWKGETAPEVSDSTELTGGVMTLNSPSFLESMGLSRKRKTTSEVTYFTCLKMLSETLAKMPIKYYQRTDKGIIEAEQGENRKMATPPSSTVAFPYGASLPTTPCACSPDRPHRIWKTTRGTPRNRRARRRATAGRDRRTSLP